MTRGFSLLLLLPFLLLSLIAQGSMIVRAPGSQGVSMVLCGQDLPVTMMIDAQGAYAPAPAGERQLPHDAKPACSWAIHAQPGLAHQQTVQAPVSTALYQAYLQSAVTLYLRRISTPAFLARGPPQAGTSHAA